MNTLKQAIMDWAAEIVIYCDDEPKYILKKKKKIINAEGKKKAKNKKIGATYQNINKKIISKNACLHSFRLDSFKFHSIFFIQII